MRQLKTILLSAILLCSSILIGQSNNNWTPVSPQKANLNTTSTLLHTDYKPFKISESYLTNLQKSSRVSLKGHELDIDLPLPDGTIETFRVSQNQVVSQTLQLEYPMIRSFTGHGVSNKDLKAYIDINHEGLSAMIFKGAAIIYIDRDYDNRSLIYLSYFRKNAKKRAKQVWSCQQQIENTTKQFYN